MHNYSSIVPLIGGETIAMQNVFGSKPEYILSYEGFENNDKHLLDYYNNKVDYHLVENDFWPKVNHTDVVNTVCPCAGLSSLSTTSNSDSSTNDWMRTSARHVLEHIQPRVFWGENAPRLASKMGSKVVNDLRAIGAEFGYTFSIFKTKSILHGLSQVRDRTFYFFWKGNKTPVFDYILRPHEKIEDTIRNVVHKPNDPMNIPANPNKPTDNAYYKYVLEELEGGITHSQFQDKIEKSINPLHYIEDIAGVKYDKVGQWMKQHGFEKEAVRCQTMYDKLERGGNIMRRGPEIPKDYIGAFVGHYPNSLTHPDEDRYLTIREALTIMKMPDDFVLQGGRRNLNHISQNVPVTTATDMARNVKLFLDGKLKMVETDFLVQDNKTQTLDYEKKSLQLDDFMV